MAKKTKRSIVTIEIDQAYENLFAVLPGNPVVKEHYPAPADQWGNHRVFTRDEWINEVRNCNTILGYWAWVQHQKESE